jgi:rare lipoprotein A
LSGKHDGAGIRRSSRTFIPVIAAVAIVGLLIGAAAAAMNLGPTTGPRPAAAAVLVTPDVSPSRTTDDRGSRSELREMPSASASASASPARPSPSATSRKPTSAATQPSGSGTVTSSGTCGVSYYSDGQRTANGEYFDPNAFTAAHRSLPFNTRVRVTNPANGKSVVVRINDRGPYVSGRCLDLSRAAFAAIASLGAGVLPAARYEVLG